MTLHSWFEQECGSERGCIERDETTGKPFWRNQLSDRRWAMADRETGARKRLAKLMARYPSLLAYVQTDPRGAALYVLRADLVESGEDIEQVYSSRGVAVY